VKEDAVSETDKTAAWNTCPKCGELVDVDECTDGSEVRCSACNKRLVCTEYTDDSWGLTPADEGDNDDSGDAFDYILDPATPQSVIDDNLRAAGLDPEAVARAGVAFVRGLKAQRGDA
jgi:DNA-directed RNA polymerase subunit RPC12/RpoP